jgi:ABC-type bacteriocin/lantibiotic exporter with double-glycine peptidase domain
VVHSEFIAFDDGHPEHLPVRMFRGKGMIQAIIQEDPTGCGIACVAMLAGVSYAEAKAAAARIGIDVDDPALWSDNAHLRRLLEGFGITLATAPDPFTSWERLPDVALLAIKWRLVRGAPQWHWVIFERQSAGPCVLDPKRGLQTNRRTDFGRMKPKWWLGVR